DLDSEDLPADAPMEGLEPIAAHTQGEESVQGAEEVPGQGATFDDVPGLEADPREPVTSELPVDAIMGTADGLETSAEGADAATEAPDAWSEIADPLAAG